MIPTDLQYVWKQLNGPQISAITQAIQNFYIEKFDNYFEYLNTLSLDTAVEENLTALGILLNYTRPTVNIVTSTYMIFVLQMSTDESIGFAATFGTRTPSESTPTGGVFVSLNTENTEDGEDYTPQITQSQLSDTDYKSLLNILKEYNIGSLLYLDQFLYQLSQQYDLVYSPSFVWETETGNLASTSFIGDLCVYSGQTDSSDTTTELQEIIEAICEQSFQPAPLGHALVVGNYYTG